MVRSSHINHEVAESEEAYSLQLRCSIHKCTSQCWPDARSAHNLVACSDGTLVLVAGDSGIACRRFDDTWQLQLLIQQTGDVAAAQSARWQPWQQQQQHLSSSASNSSSYTARSNAAATAAGDWLVLFGGWDTSGLQPVSDLEVLNLSSSSSNSSSTTTWHAPSTSGNGPSPRGQPAAAADTSNTAVYVFGGWDGQQRFNDLHRLSVGEWQWELLEPAGSGTGAAAAAASAGALRTNGGGGTAKAVEGEAAAAAAAAEEAPGPAKPCPRADHVMECWHYCDDGTWKDLLVVFGGSGGTGVLNDTWLWDVNTSTWTEAFCGGPVPCPRSSCAAAVCGDMLLLHGGQTASGAVLGDMHLLQLNCLTWLQVDLGPILQPLCRHSMAISGEACWLFGGYDGARATDSLLCIDLQPVLQLQRSSIADLAKSMACYGAPAPGPSTADGAAGAAPAGFGAAALRALSKAAAPPPLKLADLPNAEQVAAMPQWKQIRQLHQAALAAGCSMYVDPASGYSVFTAKYLEPRQCCGNKCRHCPHGWKNVQQLQQGKRVAAPAKASRELDW